MPSDIFWVALISSGAALLSAILTAKFTAASTKQQIDAQAETTKRQIEAQAEITKEQIGQQSSEARRERMIAARSDTLTSLQNSMGLLFGAHSTHISTLIGVQELFQTGVQPDDPGRKEMEDEVERQRKIILVETTNITGLRPRISDQLLVAIVDELTTDIGAIVNRGANATVQDMVEKSLDVFAGLEELRPKLPAFNGRIEELLSGDDLMQAEGILIRQR